MADSDDPFARLIETLKEPVRTTPDLTGRIMAEIERLPALGAGAAPRESPPAWSRRRFTIRLSPLGGLAVAAGLVGLVVAGGRLAGPRAQSNLRRDAAPAPVAAAQRTQFVLVAPKAASVAVVGDFNDWSMSATPLAKSDGDGVWWVTLPLTPGRYRYSFVVDGTTWLSDPEAPAAEDEFGRPNSVVTIGGP